MLLLMEVKSPRCHPPAECSSAGAITSLNTAEPFSIALAGRKRALSIVMHGFFFLCDTNYHHITIPYLLFSVKIQNVLCNDLLTEYRWHFILEPAFSNPCVDVSILSSVYTFWLSKVSVSAVQPTWVI